jgi:hypothetical protein
VFVSGVGEELPFSDTCFDLIVMNQMVEHFGRPIGGCTGGSCRERGSVIYIACPNYLRFYEPHGKISGCRCSRKLWAGYTFACEDGSSDTQSTHLQPTTAEAVGGTGPGLHSFGSAPRAVLEKTI